MVIITIREITMASGKENMVKVKAVFAYALNVGI
jgi:hypothetical protein